jgi:hypothetical protein
MTRCHVLPNIVFENDAPYRTPPCALRVLPGETTYDRDFGAFDLAMLTDGLDIAGALTMVDDDLSLFVALHDDLIDEELTPETFEDLGYSAPGWKWSSGTGRQTPRPCFQMLTPSAASPDSGTSTAGCSTRTRASST